MFTLLCLFLFYVREGSWLKQYRTIRKILICLPVVEKERENGGRGVLHEVEDMSL